MPFNFEGRILCTTRFGILPKLPWWSWNLLKSAQNPFLYWNLLFSFIAPITPHTGDTNRRKVRLFKTLHVTVSPWMAGGSHKFGSQVAFLTNYWVEGVLSVQNYLIVWNFIQTSFAHFVPAFWWTRPVTCRAWRRLTFKQSEDLLGLFWTNQELPFNRKYKNTTEAF